MTSILVNASLGRAFLSLSLSFLKILFLYLRQSMSTSAEKDQREK